MLVGPLVGADAPFDSGETLTEEHGFRSLNKPERTHRALSEYAALGRGSEMDPV